MLLALHPILSGNALFIAAILFGAGALAPMRIARPMVAVGLVLSAASAVPLPLGVYVAFTVAASAPWWPLRWVRERQRRALLLASCSLIVLEAPFDVAVAWEAGTDVRVVVVGDSLSAGGSSWPATFASVSNCRVENQAWPGARLAQGRTQLPSNIGGRCVVLIELGGNDLLGEVSPSRFEADLAALLREVRSRGCRAMMLELPLLPLQNRFGEIQRRVADERGVRLIPRRILATALAWPGHTTDGLHLSPVGHAWLGQEMARWLQCPGQP